MRQNLKFKILLILGVTIVSIWCFYPPEKKIKLGLDLHGGIHLVLQVDTKKALENEINEAVERVQADLKDKQIPFDSVRPVSETGFQILGVPREKEADARDYIDTAFSTGHYETSRTAEAGKVNWRFTMRPVHVNEFQKLAVQRAREIIERRVNELGVREPIIQQYEPVGGGLADKIIVQLPGVDDPERAKDIIGKTAQLELKLVHSDKQGNFNSRQEALQSFNNALPPEYEIVPIIERNSSDRSGVQYLVVRKAASITGKHLKSAEAQLSNSRGYSVAFTLTNQGRDIFGKVTEANIGKRLAIVLDGRAYSAPEIKSAISDRGEITGNFTAEEAKDLALVLKSGALPAPTTIIEERVVGPSLGLDSIRQGTLASLVGLLLVVTGMLIYYKLSGLNAIIALILNLIILLGSMGVLEATLTLPGIAGIALTIGMAVDTNVLIFERIKEELRHGKTVRSATEAGFKRAFSAIFDTHVTTLSAAFVLVWFGTGPIKGFAVTLIIGLLANLFTAYFGSRVIFEALLSWRRIERLSI